MILFFLSRFFKQVNPESKVRLARKLGWILYYLFPYRKKVITRNISLLKAHYPDINLRTEDLVRLNYNHLACLILEVLSLPQLSDDELKKLIHFEETSPILDKLKQEKSAVILTAHLGNWELFATSLGVLVGEPVHFVTKKLTSPSTNRYMHQMRETFGNRMIPMEYSRLVLNETLKEGKKIGLAGDQNAPLESFWETFLGLPVPIFLGAASFSLKNNAPLYFLAHIRQSDGTFKIVGEKVKSDDLDPSKKESLYILTTRHFRILEDLIHHYPDQYYWIHKRWKHTNKADQYYKTIN